MKWSRKTFWVCFFAFLILVCLSLFLKLGILPRMDKDKAPEFSLTELTGRTVGLKDFKGKVIFLTFWATLCGPCKEEMPSIEALHQLFKRRDFVVLAVAVDREGSIPVERFLAKHGY